MTPAEADLILGLSIGAAGLLAILAGYYRWLAPRIKRTRSEAVAVRDAILGREAMLDSITGIEVSPKLPGMGQRMATVEEALVSLVSSHIRLDDHERRIGSLEAATVERVVSRVDSAAAFRAMEAAINAQPDEESP